MIETFGNELAESLFYDRVSRSTRRLPSELHRVARRKLLYLHDAGDLRDLAVPPGNRLEKLKGDRKDQYSIRINERWRVVFRWKAGGAYEVQVEDYH